MILKKKSDDFLQTNLNGILTKKKIQINKWGGGGWF